MIFGLTITDTWATERIVAFIKTLHVRPTVRVILDQESYAVDLLDPAKKLSVVADVMITICDSEFIKNVSLVDYRSKTHDVLGFLKPFIKYVEIGNEISGDWLGPSDAVAEKVRAAGGLVTKAGLPRVITWYLDGANQQTMWTAMSEMKPEAEYHLISWYPNWTPDIHFDWNKVFLSLHNQFPNSKIGFGEFGLEPVTKVRRDRIKLIQEIYSIRPQVPNYCGGWFYWDLCSELDSHSDNVLSSIREVMK